MGNSGDNEITAANKPSPLVCLYLFLSLFVDSHCHLDFADLASRLDELLARMRENDVSHALCVSVNLEDFPRVRALAENHPNLYASVGVHPDYENLAEPQAAQLASLADHPKVVAIGETGLDYFRLKGNLEWQRERFRQPANARNPSSSTRVKPLPIH